MSILNLFRSRSPELWREWLPCAHRRLEYDVQHATLDEVSFGAAIQDLERFGRPSNPKPLKTGSFELAELGLEVIVDPDGIVQHYTCVFSKDGTDADVVLHDNFEPCELVLRHNSRELMVSAASSLAEVESFTGPLLREELHGETMHSAVLGRTWLGFVFDDAGRLVLADIEPAD